MAWVPVVPIINNGMGWGGSRRLPPEDRDCYMYYQRKADGVSYKCKLYYDKLKDARPSMWLEGHLFTAYAVEQDGYKERLEYDPIRDRCKFTGEIF